MKPGDRKALGEWINQLAVQTSLCVLDCASNGTGYESLLGWPLSLLYPLLEGVFSPPHTSHI